MKERDEGMPPWPEVGTGDEYPAVKHPEGATGPFRSGYVALVGAPNVGKSTLMNRLLEERLAIISPKPQTTRRKTLGILNGEGYQMVLLDTPGLMEPRYDLHHAMLREAERAFEDADVVLYMVEPDAFHPVHEWVGRRAVPRILAINKTDSVARKDDLLPLLQGYHETGYFEELIPISALLGDGVDVLLHALATRLPEGPPFYPQDQIAAQPERFFVGELIRERIFLTYREEIPYATEIEVQEFKERTAGKNYIEAWIYVESESQKGILIGKSGAAIRELGSESRIAIEEFLGREVFLHLQVRVMPKWRRKADALRRLGYQA